MYTHTNTHTHISTLAHTHFRLPTFPQTSSVFVKPWATEGA